MKILVMCILMVMEEAMGIHMEAIVMKTPIKATDIHMEAMGMKMKIHM